MGLLVGLGQHLPGRDLPEFAIPLERVRSPYLGDHGQGLFPHVLGLLRVDAHPHLLVDGGPTGAEVDAPVAKVVQHGYALGDADGMVVG